MTDVGVAGAASPLSSSRRTPGSMVAVNAVVANGANEPALIGLLKVFSNFFGSPVWVDGRLFAVSTAGELVVVEASEKFNVLHRYALKELCHSTPAVALGRMFIHTENHLVSLGGENKAGVR